MRAWLIKRLRAWLLRLDPDADYIRVEPSNARDMVETGIELVNTGMSNMDRAYTIWIDREDKPYKLQLCKWNKGPSVVYPPRASRPEDNSYAGAYS